MELINKLSNEGAASFEGAWATFMFNVEDLKMMKTLKTKDILTVLLAGLKFRGTGWSPGKARERLLVLSGKLLVKPKFETYLHVWLVTIALVTGTALPPLSLSQEAAAAAFALAEACSSKQVQGACKPQEQEPEDQGENLKFPWDMENAKLPKVLQQLWQRAKKGEQPIDIEKLLGQQPALSGLPSHAPHNNGQCDKGQDRVLKDVSEQVLKILQVQGQLFECPDVQRQLQCWQFTAEVTSTFSTSERLWLHPV